MKILKDNGEPSMMTSFRVLKTDGFQLGEKVKITSANNQGQPVERVISRIIDSDDGFETIEF